MRDHPLPIWICDNCSYRNDDDLVNCSACDHPRPDTESYADFWIDDLENDTGTAVTSVL